MSSPLATSNNFQKANQHLPPEVKSEELLKTSYLFSKKIELFLDSDGLFGKIFEAEIPQTIPSCRIEGIPNKVRENTESLRNYLEASYLSLKIVYENGQPSLVITVDLSLKGGGSAISTAKNSYDHAQNQQQASLHSDAASAWELAIQKIELARGKGYKGEEATNLNQLYRDANFNLGLAEENLEKFDDALTHFEIAKNSGKLEAKSKLIEIRLKLAAKAKDQNNISSQITHLTAAQQLGSTEALTQLAAIKAQVEEAQKLSLPQPEEHSELIKQTVKTAWLTGFQLGKGTSLEGKPTSMVLENIASRTDQIASVDESLEFLIYDQSDISRLSHIGLGVSTTQSAWYLKAIADFAKTLTLNNTFVHCITASTYLSPYQEVFASGQLKSACLRFLQKEGLEKFRKQFGTHFISGYSKGSLFLGCITLKIDNQDDLFALRATLKGSVKGLLTANASAGTVSTKTIEKKLVKIQTKTVGMKDPIDSNPQTLDDLRAQHTKFRQDIADPKNLSPAEAIFEPWLSLEEVNEYSTSGPQIISLKSVLSHSIRRALTDESTQSLNRLYTPLKAVSRVSDLNDESSGVDLYTKFESFLKGGKKVCVILGEAGGGKSSFARYVEKSLWETFEQDTSSGSYIPIRIELATLNDPVNKAVLEHLSRQGYSESQIQELKQSKKVVIFLDGYDEGKYQDKPLSQNLYQTNALSDWDGKVIILGRLNALDALDPRKNDHLKRFSPLVGEQIRQDLVEELIISPFFPAQIQEYVKKFVQNAETDFKEKYPEWFKNNGAFFSEALENVRGLSTLVKTPFVLSSVIEALPRLIQNRLEIISSDLNTHKIYSAFTQSCYEREEVKLLKRGEVRPESFEGEDLSAIANTFCKQIAQKMDAKEILSIVYLEENPKEQDEWSLYFGDSEEPSFLRTICSDVLRKSSAFVEDKYHDQYTFAHDELKHYYLSL